MKAYQLIATLSHLILGTVAASLAIGATVVTPQYPEASLVWLHAVVSYAVEVGPYVWLALFLAAAWASLQGVPKLKVTVGTREAGAGSSEKASCGNNLGVGVIGMAGAGSSEKASCGGYKRTVDGLATGEDQSKISDLVHDPAVMQEIKEGLSKLIPQLYINEKRTGSGYEDGWTSGSHDYIAVKERSLRQGLDGHLSPKLAIAMALKTEKTRHPATPVIRQALEQMNYLITELNGSKPANALFSMTVGKVKFEGVFLLRRDLLEKLDIVEGWGECKYPLKVNTYQPVELEQEGSSE